MDKIYSVLVLTPVLEVVTEPKTCTTGEECEKQAFAKLQWYECNDEPDCSCCPWDDDGYVKQELWACPECLPKLLIILDEVVSAYQTDVENELASVVRMLRASIDAPACQ